LDENARKVQRNAFVVVVAAVARTAAELSHFAIVFLHLIGDILGLTLLRLLLLTPSVLLLQLLLL
jgi:hypothetical protein